MKLEERIHLDNKKSFMEFVLIISLIIIVTIGFYLIGVRIFTNGDVKDEQDISVSQQLDPPDYSQIISDLYHANPVGEYGRLPLKADQLVYRISLEKSYFTKPVVILTSERFEGGYFLSEVDTRGFTINISGESRSIGDSFINWLVLR